MHGLAAYAVKQQFHRQVRYRACAGAREVEACIGLFGFGDQICQRPDGRVGGYHQHVVLVHTHGERRQVRLRVVGQVFVDDGVVDHGAGDGDAKGVAIGLGLGDHVGAQVAACAGFVLHDDGLFERLGRLFAHDAGHDVGAGARAKGHHQCQWFSRPGVCRMGVDGGAQCQYGGHATH
ncbi:hypothetical protein D3C72_1191990 [compost metagenome]